MAHLHVARSAILVVLSLAIPSLGAAQTRPFLFSVTIGREPGAPRATVQADLAYGRDLFSALGPERLEPRLGAQVALGGHTSVLGYVAWAAGDDAVDSRLTAQVEGLIDVLPTRSPGMLAFGVGVRRDYEGTGVALGRVVSGYRWARTLAAANLRLELPLASESEAGTRDKLDVITTFGVTRQMNDGLQLGVESVAEDLEGLVDSEEAEGGAKLMVGPSVRLGPSAARWHMLLAGGPVLRLTHSTATGVSPAPRDLTTRTGYVVRTALDYGW